MKQMSIAEIQNQSLEVLKIVDAFCRKNGIHYSLAGGTLLGAIRHKGFIPWDDDIDIIMPRPDFERLCQSFSQPGFELFCPNNRNTYINCARICDMVHTYVKCYTPWTTKQTGIWIDILPIDGINESREEFNKRAKEIKDLKNLIYQIRGGKRKIIQKMDLKKILINVYKRLKYGFLDIYKYVDKYQKLVTGNYENANFCGQLTAPEFIFKEYLPKSWFDEYVEVEFESIHFQAIKEYDQLLRNYFNDYYILPPVEKRVPKHDELTYYWK